MKYENSPLREITGKFLRPGGAELTRHGLGLCKFVPGALVLDLGCGPGGTLAVLRDEGLRPLGLDMSAAFLAEAKESGPALRADMAAPPIREGALDGIVCECALSLAPDKGAVLRECARCLRPGGRLLLCDLVRPAKSAEPGRAIPKESCAPSGYGGVPCAAGAEYPEALADMLRESGFAVLVVEDHSKALRELAARIVWRFGSLAAFAALISLSPLSPSGPCGRGAGRSPDADSGVSGPHAALSGDERPGYCLIVAEKQGAISYESTCR